MHRSLPALALVLFLVAGCGDPKPQHTPVPPQPPPVTEVPPAPPEATVPLRLPAPGHLVAIGDVHGDMDALRRVLRLGGAIDREDRWIGGDLVVVHTGDTVDRGDDDRAMLELMARLGTEAAAAGGACIALNGNHEMMNASGDRRSVSKDALASYAEIPDLDVTAFADVPAAERAHAAAFAPGGPMGRILAERPVVAIVGDSVFVHGGVLPANVDYGLDRINGDARSWLTGIVSERPAWVRGDDSPVWSRHYSDEPDAVDCAMLTGVLESLGVRRMVVGHTVQKTGISSACDEGVWRIDTGMSSYYGGDIQLLEVVGDDVRVVQEAGATTGAGGR